MRVCDGIPVSFTIVTNFQCTIVTIVNYLQASNFISWYIAKFMTAWIFKCNWIYLWSIRVLNFSGCHNKPSSSIEYRSTNGSIHPDYGRQCQAEFISGHFFNLNCCSALAPVQKQSRKGKMATSYFCIVPCDCH